MTEDEAFELFLDKDEPTARAMFRFRTECARLEQAEAQRKPLSTRRRILMEYEAVKSIVEALGHTLPNDPLHMHEGKWWFWDEAWADRYGPFETRIAAKGSLEAYCKELSGEP
jgi:hypothetical protein